MSTEVRIRQLRYQQRTATTVEARQAADRELAEALQRRREHVEPRAAAGESAPGGAS